MRTIHCVLVGALLLVSGNTLALPRFAAQTGWKCQSCHVNPTGGGMRQTLGVQYGRETLPVPEWSKDLELEDFSTLLTSFLGVGADLRTMYYYRQVPPTNGTGDSTNNAFWQMEGNLHLNFRLAKKVNIYLSKGLYSGFEVFGMLNVLPANGYVKVGKFTPGYGLRVDDHTAWIRLKTGFSPETGRPERTGFELGVNPGIFSVLGGLYNAADGFGLSGSQKSALVRAEALTSLSEEIHLGIGGNAFFSRTPAGIRQDRYGGFGMFSYDSFSILGEADLLKDGETTGLVTWAEMNIGIIQGLGLTLSYDFFDEDTSVKAGSMSRYGFGLEFYPLSGVEVRPMYRIAKEKPDDQPDNDFVMILHFYL